MAHFLAQPREIRDNVWENAVNNPGPRVMIVFERTHLANRVEEKLRHILPNIRAVQSQLRTMGIDVHWDHEILLANLRSKTINLYLDGGGRACQVLYRYLESMGGFVHVRKMSVNMWWHIQRFDPREGTRLSTSCSRPGILTKECTGLRQLRITMQVSALFHCKGQWKRLKTVEELQEMIALDSIFQLRRLVRFGIYITHRFADQTMVSRRIQLNQDLWANLIEYLRKGFGANKLARIRVDLLDVSTNRSLRL